MLLVELLVIRMILQNRLLLILIGENLFYLVMWIIHTIGMIRGMVYLLIFLERLFTPVRRGMVMILGRVESIMMEHIGSLVIDLVILILKQSFCVPLILLYLRLNLLKLRRMSFIRLLLQQFLGRRPLKFI